MLTLLTGGGGKNGQNMLTCYDSLYVADYETIFYLFVKNNIVSLTNSWHSKRQFCFKMFRTAVIHQTLNSIQHSLYYLLFQQTVRYLVGLLGQTALFEIIRKSHIRFGTPEASRGTDQSLQAATGGPWGSSSSLTWPTRSASRTSSSGWWRWRSSPQIPTFHEFW